MDNTQSGIEHKWSLSLAVFDSSDAYHVIFAVNVNQLYPDEYKISAIISPFVFTQIGEDYTLHDCVKHQIY